MVSELTFERTENPEQAASIGPAIQMVERIAPAASKEAQQKDTKDLVDKRVLPFLDLFWQDGGGEVSRPVVERHPELNDPDKLASTLRQVLPLADKNHDGATKSELRKFAQSSEGTESQRAAAQVASEHFRAFSELVRDDWFFQGIKENDMNAFDNQLKYVHLAKKHTELQDPNVFIQQMKAVGTRMGTGRDGFMAREQLTYFVDHGSGSELEKSAAALAATNYKTLSELAPGRGFLDNTDLMLIEAVAKPDLKERMARTLEEAEKNRQSPAVNGAIWAAIGYAIASAAGDEHPGRTAIATGVSGAAAAEIANSRVYEAAAGVLKSRQQLVDTGLFKIPPIK